MLFWIIAGGLTLALCFLAFYPLFFAKTAIRHDMRDKLNKAFYFHRLKEVEQEAQEGVIDDLNQTQRELQQSLLDDIPLTQTSKTVDQGIHKGWFVLLVLFVLGVSGGAYWHVGSWQATEAYQASGQNLQEFYRRLDSTDAFTQEEMQQFSLALRAELQQKPQDDKGWFLLGELGMSLEDGQLAHDSFAKAYQLQPDNPQYMLRYAEMLLFSEDAQDKAQGDELLKKVIRQDHANLNALSLLAFRAFEQEDYKMAAITWGMMLKLLPENDPRRATIEKSMESARSMIKTP
ncbi:c-type cytochrome biogenesis protein CcmI [Pasteurellaceae bacterium Macca]|nr:c-type cytochrome biogenesis protein CcmI [Pasteurellaceae bacterium Macca]